EVAKTPAGLTPFPHRVGNPVRRSDADISRDQQLFERLDRVDVDDPRRVVCAPDDLVEPLDDLLLGPPEAFAEPAEDTHCLPVSASARWRRSISASTAVRTSECPSRTAAICVAIGSSTP